MSVQDIHQVAFLIKRERNNILKEWEQQVRKVPAARHLDTASVIDHIGDLLDEMARELETCSDETTIEGLQQEPMTHALHRLQLNFNLEELVQDYSELRKVLQKFIERDQLHWRGSVNYTINRVIDTAIGISVKTYADEKAREVQQKREEHLTFLTHDLRSPLSAISLAMHLFEKRMGDQKNEHIEKFLNHLRRNVRHLNLLVTRILHEELLTAETGSRVTGGIIKLKELIDKVTDDMSPLAESSGAAFVNKVDRSMTVYGDENLVTLIFQNLLSNAVKYAPNGEIVLGAKELPTGEFLECWVKDNGAGIPEDRLGKVFNKLETDPGRRGGLGLGLAIVKRFVEVHHGKISVESKPGQGATFRFTLPTTPFTA